MTDASDRPPFRFFAKSAADAWLVAVAFAGIALLALAYAVWPIWPIWATVLLLLFMCFIICTNYQCVAHNFVHNEFFALPVLNTVFSVINTLAIGFPQTIFHQHHLNHHRFNNAPFARDGSPGDLSSLQRYSPGPGIDEPFLKYCILSPLRADILAYARAAFRRGMGARLVLESVVLTLFWIALAGIDWKFFLLLYVPLIYLGHVLTYAEGYFEHHRTVPGDKMRNAVSSYGRFYNFIWFNNGFHQEHHCYPTVHWTHIPQYRGRMLPDEDRRVVPFAHWLNF